MKEDYEAKALAKAEAKGPPGCQLRQACQMVGGVVKVVKGTTGNSSPDQATRPVLEEVEGNQANK